MSYILILFATLYLLDSVRSGMPSRDNTPEVLLIVAPLCRPPMGVISAQTPMLKSAHRSKNEAEE